MPSSVKSYPVRRLTTDALLLCVALMLSYLEALLPIVPLPGVRLGLAQSVVTVAYFRLGRTDAAVISAARVALMALLFGSVTSLYFSACGALLSYLGLYLGDRLLRKRCSYIGLGVLCAALHNVGQCVAAATLFGGGLLLTYLPALLVVACAMGALGGVIVCALIGRIPAPKGGTV
ncbi:MAG: Gx transporter family protein [Clostridia bacterium]|nr:Gx transporter family protein [Clostridia bacterium]